MKKYKYVMSDNDSDMQMTITVIAEDEFSAYFRALEKSIIYTGGKNFTLRTI